VAINWTISSMCLTVEVDPTVAGRQCSENRKLSRTTFRAFSALTFVIRVGLASGDREKRVSLRVPTLPNSLRCHENWRLLWRSLPCAAIRPAACLN
jgi:hypothetical protein